eukprot:gene13706-13823_t
MRRQLRDQRHLAVHQPHDGPVAVLQVVGHQRDKPRQRVLARTARERLFSGRDNRFRTNRLGQIGKNAQTNSPEAAMFACAAIRRTISAAFWKGQGEAPPSRGNRPEQSKGVGRMRVVLITNNLVRLSFTQALLRDAGVESFLLDGHVSSVEGSIGAIPRRLAVDDDDELQALRILREAGELV